MIRVSKAMAPINGIYVPVFCILVDPALSLPDHGDHARRLQ